MILGFRILYQAYKRNKKNKKVKKAGWLAGAGGFLDSFGGGGWGPLVTSTLISKGRSPQYVIGSVSLSEFFVTLSSAMSFFVFIGITHWQPSRHGLPDWLTLELNRRWQDKPAACSLTRERPR